MQTRTTTPSTLFSAACILAGGKSTRMGYDKQLLRIHNHLIFDRTYETLKQHFAQILVVTNHSHLYLPYDVQTIQDVYPNCGPLGGIHAALQQAKSNYVYFIGCDMPNVNLAYIEYMQRIITNTHPMACVCQKQGHIEPLNAFYSKKALDVIEQDLQANKCSVYYLLKKLETYYVDEKIARHFSPDWSMFLNINTQEDLAGFAHTIS